MNAQLILHKIINKLKRILEIPIQLSRQHSLMMQYRRQLATRKRRLKYSYLVILCTMLLILINPTSGQESNTQVVAPAIFGQDADDFGQRFGKNSLDQRLCSVLAFDHSFLVHGLHKIHHDFLNFFNKPLSQSFDGIHDNNARYWDHIRERFNDVEDLRIQLEEETGDGIGHIEYKTD